MRAFILALVLLLPVAAAAQPASLVADSIRIEADRTLVAEGAVEVFYDDTRLTASRIVYDGETEALTIEGPLTISEAGGDIVAVAEAGALEPGLRDGILRGARLVLDQQLQIAADQIAQIDGRYRQLTRAVASSCRVCASNPTPLWEIRAARVLHDTETRQIYFSQAQFRVMGVPVFYLPRLRLPDPTVERARGFLVPQYRHSDVLGAGIRVPYFLPLGRSADLTFGPYLASETRTLEWRYRQAFRRGALTFRGAVSQDELRSDETRAFVFGSGEFALPYDFELGFDLRLTSDDEYLLDYGYSDDARLGSGLAVTRVRERELIAASVTHYDILRPGGLRGGDRFLVDLASTEYERVFATRAGRLSLRFDATALWRDPDRPVEGRDVVRAGAAAGWAAGTVLPGGLVADARAELRADAYGIRNDPRYDDNVTRVAPKAALALRWPLARTSARGTHEAIVPTVQLAWAEVHGEEVPNEDSRLAEFDEGSLFALGRFPGHDRVETGARLDFGLGYTRIDPAGWQVNAIVGRVLRFDDTEQFAESTGLNGTWSDWLVSAQVAVGDRLTLTNRAVFDDALSVARNELRLAYNAGRAELATSYLWLEEGETESRPYDVHEVRFDAEYHLSRHWLASIEGRYDFEAERAAEAELDLTYRNECITVDLSLSRRFASPGIVEPSYDLGLTVALAGFGNDDAARYRRTCPG